MKALVWAAGFGTRLRPLSNILPKPLFPVVNIPMIDLIFKYLSSWGISDIGINTHYLRELLVPYLKNIHYINLFITEEENILGTGGGTVKFKNFLKDDELFIVHTGDILSTINLYDAIKFHKEHNNIVTFILVDCKPINHVSILKDGTVVDIANNLGRKEDKSVRNLAGSAITVYSNEFLYRLPDREDYFEINPVILDIIQKEPGRVMAYIPDKPYYWRDIGTVQSYWEAHRDILENKVYRVENITDNHICHSSSYVSNDVTLEGFSVTGKNVKISGMVKIKNSIIWDNVEISGCQNIENAIVTKDSIINT